MNRYTNKKNINKSNKKKNIVKGKGEGFPKRLIHSKIRKHKNKKKSFKPEKKHATKSTLSSFFCLFFLSHEDDSNTRNKPMGLREGLPFLRQENFEMGKWYILIWFRNWINYIATDRGHARSPPSASSVIIRILRDTDTRKDNFSHRIIAFLSSCCYFLIFFIHISLIFCLGNYLFFHFSFGYIMNCFLIHNFNMKMMK